MWGGFNATLYPVFEAWFGLFDRLPVTLQLALAAVPVTAFALLVFRLVSDQAAILAVKEKIKAHLLEMWLYKDVLRVVMRAQLRVFVLSVRYLGLSLLPLAVMIVPVALIIVQIENRFAYAPLSPGDGAIVAVVARTQQPVSRIPVSLETSAGLRQETPPVRIDERGEILWRIRATEPGDHWVTVRVGEDSVERRIRVGGTSAVWPFAYATADWRVLGSPAEPPLPESSPVVRTEVDYARARAEFVGLSTASWMLFGFSLLFAFLMRGWFGVTF